MKVWPNSRWSVPMTVLGSSLPRTRAHQLCRSWVSVPPPICPSLYCFFSPVTWMTGRFSVSLICAPPYTVSIKVFSMRLNRMTPSASAASVKATL